MDRRLEIDFGRTVSSALAQPNPSGGQLVTVIDRPLMLPHRHGWYIDADPAAGVRVRPARVDADPAEQRRSATPPIGTATRKEGPVRPARFSAHRVVAMISGAAWVWSWYTMYLEVHRWKHLTKSFRFNPGPPIPGTTIRPRPGLPLKALVVCAAGSPAVFAAAIAAMARTRAVTWQERSGHRRATGGD